MRSGESDGRMSATAVNVAGSCASASAMPWPTRLVHSDGEINAATMPSGVHRVRAKR